MKLFSKKNELVVRNSEIQPIQVRDLKEYLVKDFEQIKTSEQIIENLKSQIEELNKIKIKYDATLITLEEFDARVLREKDKKRKINYKYYTDQDWGVCDNYDISLNTGTLGIDKCVDIIEELVK